VQQFFNLKFVLVNLLENEPWLLKCTVICHLSVMLMFLLCGGLLRGFRRFFLLETVLKPRILAA